MEFTSVNKLYFLQINFLDIFFSVCAADYWQNARVKQKITTALNQRENIVKTHLSIIVQSLWGFSVLPEHRARSIRRALNGEAKLTANIGEIKLGENIHALFLGNVPCEMPHSFQQFPSQLQCFSALTPFSCRMYMCKSNALVSFSTIAKWA